MKFHTALRAWANRRLEKVDHADIVVGIPCFNSDTTIDHVIDIVSEGLAKYYPEQRAVVIISMVAQPMIQERWPKIRLSIPS